MTNSWSGNACLKILIPSFNSSSSILFLSGFELKWMQMKMIWFYLFSILCTYLVGLLHFFKAPDWFPYFRVVSDSNYRVILSSFKNHKLFLFVQTSDQGWSWFLKEKHIDIWRNIFSVGRFHALTYCIGQSHTLTHCTALINGWRFSRIYSFPYL